MSIFEWIGSTLFEETVGRIGYVSDLKKRWEEYEEKRKKMEDIHIPILSFVLYGMKEGSARQADLSDKGRFADKFNEEIAPTGKEAKKKALDWSKEEVEGQVKPKE